jgi:hypothetical protein
VGARGPQEVPAACCPGFAQLIYTPNTLGRERKRRKGEQKGRKEDRGHDEPRATGQRRRSAGSRPPYAPTRRACRCYLVFLCVLCFLLCVVCVPLLL